VVIAATAYELFLAEWVWGQVVPQWDALDPKTKTAVGCGAAAAVAVLFAVVYWRLVGGVKAAIREQAEALAPAA